MDWSTVALSVLSAAVSGGLIGGGVSLLVAKRESGDRRAALALEREKWETERSDRRAKELLEQTRAGRKELISACEDMFNFVGSVDEWSHPDRRLGLEGVSTRAIRLHVLSSRFGTDELQDAVGKFVTAVTEARYENNAYELPRDEALAAIDNFMLAQQKFIAAMEHYRLHIDD